VQLTKHKQEIYNYMNKLDYLPKTDLEKLVVSELIEKLPLSDGFLTEVEHLEFQVENYQFC